MYSSGMHFDNTENGLYLSVIHGYQITDNQMAHWPSTQENIALKP